jgi:hypothetical protein
VRRPLMGPLYQPRMIDEYGAVGGMRIGKGNRSTSRISDPVPLKKKLNAVALVRERTMPTERPPLAGEVVPTFADRGCRVVSATDSHGR